jgi:hypothetical protein
MSSPLPTIASKVAQKDTPPAHRLQQRSQIVSHGIPVRIKRFAQQGARFHQYLAASKNIMQIEPRILMRCRALTSHSK